MKNGINPEHDNFLKLLPRGTNGNDFKSTQVSPAKPEIALEIKTCRCTLMEKVNGSKNNQQNVYRSLGRKVPFLLKYLPGISSPEVLDDILADRSTLFSSDYANAQLNRPVIEHILQRYGTTPETVHDYCAKRAWSEYCLHVPAKAREDQAIVMDTLRQLDQIARRKRNPIRYYQKELHKAYNLAADGQEPQALLRAMKDLELPVSIRPDRIEGFFNHCFDIYCSERRNHHLLKKDIGYFKPNYTENDAAAFAAYQKRKDQLSCFRKACRNWNRQNDFPFSEAEQMIAVPLPSGFDRTGFLQLVGDYLAETRGKNGLNEEQALQALRYALSVQEHAPIRFLMICVHNRQALISYKNGKNRDLDWNDIRSFERHVYRKTPSFDKQRISRLKLLIGLCRLIGYSRKQIQDNLMYFLKYHGYVIMDEEEAVLWKQALEEYILMNKPVSLALRYYTYRLECISFDPRTLYNYEACSQLHLGGWLSFSDNDLFCRLLEDKAHKKQIKIDNEKEYLEEWGADEPNIDKIKALCSKAAQQQENIKAITRWIEQWDEASHTGEHWTKHPVVPHELYALLIESAIQHKLIGQAQDILIEKIRTMIPRK